MLALAGEMLPRILPLVLLATACASDGDEDIWMPPSDPGGKGDAVSTIKGTDIPSAHVDPSKSYLLSRQIRSLQDAGAFDMIESRLASRIDGIIANMPSDGRLHLAELVRMEEPQIHSSLFPDEVAALSRIWKKVEAPSTSELVVGADASFGAVDAALPPGPAVPPASLPISSLLTEHQEAATRLQNRFNADGNTTTVSYTDVNMGIASPGAFTPAEVTAFNAILLVFKEQAIAKADARVAVSPAPGAYAKNLNVGPIGLAIQGSMVIEEVRSRNGAQLRTTLAATQAHTTTATLPADAKVLLIAKDSGTEAVFGPGPAPAFQGPTVLEVWQSGQRIYSSNATLPDLTRNAKLDLTSKLDYTLVAGVTPLVRNVVSASRIANGTLEAKFRFDKVATPATGTVDASVLTATATPTVKLPVGRYTLPMVNWVFHVYPGNVLWLTQGTNAQRLLPRMTNGNQSVPGGFEVDGLNLRFDAATNGLTISNQFNRALTGAMRDL